MMKSFGEAIGPAKHRAHLNYVYGVAVEEALQLVIEQEVLKERRSLRLGRRREPQRRGRGLRSHCTAAIPRTC